MCMNLRALIKLSDFFTMSDSIPYDNISTSYHAPRYVPFDIKITLVFRFTRGDGSPIEHIPQSIRNSFSAMYTCENFCSHLYIDAIDYTTTKFDQDYAHMILHASGAIENWLDPDDFNRSMLKKWLRKNEKKIHVSESGSIYRCDIITSDIMNI